MGAIHYLGRNIHVGGVPVAVLADTYGTPVYVYDADRIRENYRRVHNAFASEYPQFSIHYAIKACNNLSIADLLIREGAGADTASPNEIQLARLLGLAADRILFTGNNLSDQDLRYALDSGVTINLDDHAYLERLLKYGCPETISFRVNPGPLQPDYAHSQIGAFVGPQSKFGVHPRNVKAAYKAARDAGVRRFGAHVMAGSNVLDYRHFAQVAGRLLDIVAPVVTELRIPLEFVDLGGGLGIPYADDANALDVKAVAASVTAAIKEKCHEYKLPLPRLMIEPARYFVGDAGVVIGRIQSKKDSYSSIYGTDISMSTFARTVMYKARHRIFVDGRDREPKVSAGICGQVCENTDVWETNAELPEDTAVGDIVVLADAGAYGFSMSYQYNGRLRPAEVLVDGGAHRLIRRAETFDDMISGMAMSREMEERYNATRRRVGSGNA